MSINEHIFDWKVIVLVNVTSLESKCTILSTKLFSKIITSLMYANIWEKYIIKSPVCLVTFILSLILFALQSSTWLSNANKLSFLSLNMQFVIIIVKLVRCIYSLSKKS